MVLMKHPQSIKICLALVVSLFSTGLLPTSYAYAAKPAGSPGNSGASQSQAKSEAPKQQTRYASYSYSQPAPVESQPAKSHGNAEPQEAYSEPAPAPTQSAQKQKMTSSKTATQPTKVAHSKNVTPGNNGTIKVTEVGDPNTSPPNNDPHVACTFDVEFYKFDANAVSNVGFNPSVGPQGTPDTARVSSGNTTVNLDGDGVTGGTRFDGEETYSLATTGTPHPKQGYHIKVTANTTWSNGSTKKSKVFWFQPCTTTTTTVTPPGGHGGGGDTQTPPKKETPTHGHVLASILGSPSPKVLGAATAQLPAMIPATGGISNGNPFLILLASLAAYGAVYFLQGRRKLEAERE